jgi:aerobic carbon-monoxide dehydrogenase large subunit
MVAKTQGHGHETTFGTIIANALQIPLEQVKIVQCAPGTKLKGNGTGGSRSTVGAGSVCHLAAHKLIEEGKALAALELQLEPSQVTYTNGEFKSDASDRVVKLADLAKAEDAHLHGRRQVRIDVSERLPHRRSRSRSRHRRHRGRILLRGGRHRRVINHAIVEGQLHGGVVQGAGQVFGEQIVYDPETGQSLTATFMDYYMPRAGLIPEIRGEEHPTESRVSPLGVKGVGESGCTASIPCLVGAVLDAVRPVGVKQLDMPLTPARVWRAIRCASD